MRSPDLISLASSTDENALIAERRDKLAAIRARGIAFPNDFKPKHRAAELARKYGHLANEALEPQALPVSVAGRLMLKRVMGKASFATLQDASGRIQLRVSVDALGEADYAFFKHFDLGEIVGAEGTLFKTKTGELTVKVARLRLLTKSLRPLPDKFHGLADAEDKYRQRYVDLITDETARARFAARSKTLASIDGFDETRRIAADFRLMTKALSATAGQAVVFSHPLVAMLESGVSNGSVGQILRANCGCYASSRELGTSPFDAAICIGAKLARETAQKIVAGVGLTAHAWR